MSYRSYYGKNVIIEEETIDKLEDKINKMIDKIEEADSKNIIKNIEYNFDNGRNIAVIQYKKEMF